MLFFGTFLLHSPVSIFAAAPTEEAIENSVRAAIIRNIRGKWNVTSENVTVKFRNLEGISLPSVADGFEVALAKNASVLGNIILRVNFLKKEHYVGHYELFLTVDAVTDFVYAARQIQVGTLVRRDDLKLISQGIYNKPGNAVIDLNQIVGREAVFTIQQDALMLSWMLRRVPLVRKTEPVSAVYQGDGISLKLEGIALADGVLNEKIQVRVLPTNKILLAEVIGTHNVKITPNN